MRKFLLALALLLLLASPAFAGTVTLKWDVSTGATSYEIEQSVDSGATYVLVASPTATIACGTATTCSHTLVAPSTGLVLFRFSSVNSVGKTTRFGEGAWHCESCKPPLATANVGVQ